MHENGEGGATTTGYHVDRLSNNLPIETTRTWPQGLQAPAPTSAEWRAHFGPFTLSISERLLERDGIPCRLGGRAFDVLAALVEVAGETLSKRELMARVWPDIVVEEGSLRFHMVAIRKTLGEGEGGNRYIINTANKGYTFVARVERKAPAQRLSTRTVTCLPALATAITGRDEDISAIVSLLLQRRLVSVVGAGGIGKTTVSIAACQTASAQFDGDVHFVDLSMVSGPALVRATVAASVGLQAHLDDLPALIAHLRDRRSLIVLDCCEHMVDEAAVIAESLTRDCPQVHVLATSREPLRAAGEFVFRLRPLAYPPEGEGESAETALAYAAVRLFADRAAANAQGFSLNDGNAAQASRLCRDLGGLALAIELAAGRIEALGLEAISSHFDASSTLLWHGRRTALPRHQTLAATLEWSFNLLSDDEKCILRRLSVFAGSFTLEAAIDICCSGFDRAHAIDLIASLVAKSLVNVDAGGATLRYSMLDTTRSHCRKELADAGNCAYLARQYWNYFHHLIQTMYAMRHERIDCFRLELPNLRAALEREFLDTEDFAGAVSFAAAFCPLLLHISRVAECSQWAQAALARLPASMTNSPAELQLQGALGQSLTFARGGSCGEAEQAYLRAIALAKQLCDSRAILHLLNGYAVLLHREGRYTDALDVSRQAQALLPEFEDAESQAIVDSLMGVSLHLVGDVTEAMQHWGKCISHMARVSPETRSQLGFDYHIRALCGLARSLWFMGKHRRAVSVAEDALEKARGNGHAVTYCIALIWGGSVFGFGQDVTRLAAVADELERVARSHSLEPYLNVASSIRGQILIMRGQAADGVELIQASVRALRACRYEMINSSALTCMARGLSDMALHSAALAICDEAERLIRTGGDYLRMPELLSTRGMCLVAAGQKVEGERAYEAAIALATSQGSRSELVRAAVALAKSTVRAGIPEPAHRLLRQLVADAGDESSPELAIARALLRDA